MITLFNLISQSVSGLTSFGRSRHSLLRGSGVEAPAKKKVLHVLNMRMAI